MNIQIVIKDVVESQEIEWEDYYDELNEPSVSDY